MQRKNYSEVKIQQSESVSSRIIEELENAPDYIPRTWTDFQEDLMRRYYKTKGPAALAKAVGRSLDSVAHKARSMGL